MTQPDNFRFTMAEIRLVIRHGPFVRYWWVHHDKTYRHEIAGGYIWAPKEKALDRRLQYYDRILRVALGDSILSCAEGSIGHAGLVADHAIGERGRGGDGWWLPVDWVRLPAPVVPAAAPPAYLSELPEASFHAILRNGGLEDWPQPLSDPPEPGSVAQVAASRLDYDAALTASVRDQQVKARRGQGLFRFRVFQIESMCRLTGIANPDLLIASHIKPWRLCETTHERLDGANGLILTPHVDRLFDRGLISFSDEGEVLLSPALAAGDLRRLGLETACRGSVGSFSQRQCIYLAWHRDVLFDRGKR